MALIDQKASEDAAFTFTVPTGTFTDVDAGDTLTLAATLSNGDALPTWLAFDTATRTFSGTPANDDVGNINLKLTATDRAGASVSSAFAVSVANTNDAPMVTGTIANQSATEASAFSYALPAGLFSDIDVGDSLRYSATLATGNPLPTWSDLQNSHRAADSQRTWFVVIGEGVSVR